MSASTPILRFDYSIPSTSANSVSIRSSRICVGAAVVAVHGIIFYYAVLSTFVNTRVPRGGNVRQVFDVRFIDDPVPMIRMPEISVTEPKLTRVQSPTIEPPTIPESQDLQESNGKSGIDASRIHFRVPFAPPRLDAEQTLDKARYRLEAGLGVGRVVTVLLLLQISNSGTVTAVSIERSCGDERLDDLAVRYATETHWQAGIVRDQPQAMQIRFPVTFTENA